MKTFLFLCLISVSAFAQKSHILIITDSHGEGAFGPRLVQLLEAKKWKVSAYAIGGSVPSDFITGRQMEWGYWEHQTGKPDIRRSKPLNPKLVDLLIKHHPDYLIIELGTNFIWRDFTDQEKKAALDLVKKIKARNGDCFWIGPPDLRLDSPLQIERIAGAHHLLQNEVQNEGCTLFESWNFTKYPATGGDGIHYDNEPSTKWADEAFKFLDQHLP
jgi:hypothetical protein